MNTKASENWTFCLSNLKILMNSIELYFTKFLNLNFNRDFIDINLIARNENRDEIKKLCQLFLTILVLNENNNLYIEKITSMDQADQNILMELEKQIIYNPGFSPNTYSTSQHANEYKDDFTSLKELLEKSENENKQLLAKNEVLGNSIQEIQSNLETANKQIETLKMECERYKCCIEKQSEMINPGNKNFSHSLFSKILNYTNEVENDNDENLEKKLIKVTYDKNTLQSENEILLKTIEDQKDAIQSLSLKEQMKSNELISSNDYIANLKARINNYENQELKLQDSIKEVSNLNLLMKQKEEEQNETLKALNVEKEESIKIKDACMQKDYDLKVLREENLKLKIEVTNN